MFTYSTVSVVLPSSPKNQQGSLHRRTVGNIYLPKVLETYCAFWFMFFPSPASPAGGGAVTCIAQKKNRECRETNKKDKVFKRLLLTKISIHPL